MSDEFTPEFNEQDVDEQYEEIEEEISTAEVDRVLQTLETLMESVDSETIHEYLEESYNHIFALVYEEEDAADQDEESGEMGDQAEAA